MNRTNALAVGDAGRMVFTDVRTYMYAVIFLLGNIMLPQLCHLVPGAGATWLPIYFFTLVGAYLMGWRVGLLTAVASPLVNSVVFGMPAPELLPVIMMKSSLLAISASVAAHLFRNVSLVVMLSVVVAYQALGTVGEWLMGASWFVAFQDFRIGMPGMLVQIVGGYLLIRYFLKKGI